MKNEIKAEGTTEAMDLDHASLDSVKGGASTVLSAAVFQRPAADVLARKLAPLKLADLFGRNLLIDKIAISNTDWQ